MLIFIVCLLTFMGVKIQPENKEDVRRELANPASETQEFTYQYRGNQNYGPYNREQTFLIMQPKLYTPLNDWHWVHHVDFPIVAQPDAEENKSTLKVGDTLYRSYLSSNVQNEWVWGLGPAFKIPGSGGSSFVLLYQASIFTMGAEATQLWGEESSVMEVRPIVKLRLGKKTTVGFLDTIYMDWKSPQGDHLTFPMGLEVVQLFRGTEDTPISVNLGVFSNIERPDYSSDWYWRLSVNWLISK